MAELNTSAAEVRAVLERGLKVLNAFRDADKALALLENMEQVARERQAAIDALNVEADKVSGQVDEAKSELASAKKKAKELVDAAASRAEQHETNAKAYAAKVTKEADERADKVKAEADALVAQCLEKSAEIADLDKQAKVAKEVIAKAEKIQQAMR
jgi:uncharacterized coiled-coil DUF342 family protein